MNLKIIDITGKEVVKIVAQKQAPGNYTIRWNGKNQEGGFVSSGIYFIQLKTDNSILTRKTLLIR